MYRVMWPDNIGLTYSSKDLGFYSSVKSHMQIKYHLVKRNFQTIRTPAWPILKISCTYMVIFSKVLDKSSYLYFDIDTNSFAFLYISHSFQKLYKCMEPSVSLEWKFVLLLRYKCKFARWASNMKIIICLKKSNK